MRWARCLAAIVSGACALIGTLYFAASAGAVFPGEPGRLVFDGGPGNDATVLWDYDPGKRQRRQLTRAISRCRFHTPEGVENSWDDRAPDYAPDGRLIAYIHSDSCPGGDERDGIWVVSADGSSRRMVARPATEGVFPEALAFSPDGRRLAVFGQGDRESQNVQLLYDVQTGVRLRRRNWNTDRLPSGAGIDWAANGRLAAATSDGIRRLMPRGVLGERLSFPPPDEADFFASDDGPDWSPSGRTIAFARLIQRGVDEGASARVAQARLRYSIWTAPMRSRRAAVRLVRSRDVLFEPVFSPDGRWLAYANRDGVRLIPSRGGRSRLLLRGEIASTIDWQPDR